MTDILFHLNLLHCIIYYNTQTIISKSSNTPCITSWFSIIALMQRYAIFEVCLFFFDDMKLRFEYLTFRTNVYNVLTN